MRGLGKNVCNRIIVRRQWKHLDTCCHGLTHLGVLWNQDQVDHHAFVKIIRLILQHDKEDDNDKKYDDDEDVEEKVRVKEEEEEGEEEVELLNLATVVDVKETNFSPVVSC